MEVYVLVLVLVLIWSCCGENFWSDDFPSHSSVVVWHVSSLNEEYGDAVERQNSSEYLDKRIDYENNHKISAKTGGFVSFNGVLLVLRLPSTY